MTMRAGAELWNVREGDVVVRRLVWWCPGCETNHGVPIEGSKAWAWNGSIDTPTLSPSIKHTIEYGDPSRKTHICHYFVEQGEIRFLNYCTHAYAGRTVRVECDL